MIGLGQRMFGGDPRAHRQEIGGAWNGYSKFQAGLAAGLCAGTPVATAMGWRPVEAIAPGDLVLTFDRGLQPVRHVTRGLLWTDRTRCATSLLPLLVPAGALGNDDEMLLLPEQPVLVESDTAEDVYGDPFALLKGADLAGLRGIAPVPCVGDIEVVQLQFEFDEVVFASNGALLFCSSDRAVEAALLQDAEGASAPYQALNPRAARALVALIAEEDAEVERAPVTVIAARCGLRAVI